MKSVQAFNELLNKYSNGRDTLTTLTDFLEWSISGFSHSIKFERDYKEKESQQFYHLLQNYSLLMNHLLYTNEWYDVFGEIYEDNVSTKKAQHAGQFFTPVCIVNMQTILIGNEIKGSKISDPTCGSGRYLISHHAYSKGGNFYFGEDLDKLCCLMAVVNMLFHGAVGEVVWHDSLSSDSFFYAWRINEKLNITGIPHVEECKKEDSLVMKMSENRKQEVIENQNTVIKKGGTIIFKDESEVSQLSFEF